MTEEETLVEKANWAAKCLDEHPLWTNSSNTGNLLDGPAIAGVLRQMVTALNQPAPHVPTIQVIAERQSTTRFIRDQGVATMLTASKSAPDASVDPQASFAASVAMQLAERIERGDHVPPLLKVEEEAPCPAMTLIARRSTKLAASISREAGTRSP